MVLMLRSMRNLSLKRHVEGIGVAEELVVRAALVTALDHLAVEHLLREHIVARKAAGHRALKAVMPPSRRDRRARRIDGDLESVDLALLGQFGARHFIG